MGLCCICGVACTERSEDPSTFRTWWSSRSSKKNLERPLGCGPYPPSLAARRQVGAVPASVLSHQSVQCRAVIFAAFISAGGGGLRSLTSEHTLYPQSKLPVMWETPVQAITSLDPHALRISTFQFCNMKFCCWVRLGLTGIPKEYSSL